MIFPVAVAEREWNKKPVKVNTFPGRGHFKKYLRRSRKVDWVSHYTDPRQTERDHPLMGR